MATVNIQGRVLVKCEYCPQTVRINKWAMMRAGSRGWFFSWTEDTAYCEEHLPEWVKSWRRERKN